jgi:hypothetical protein
MFAVRIRNELTFDQLFGVQIGKPEALLGNADRNYFVFRPIHGLHDRCGRQKGDFMFAATSAEKHTYTEFLRCHKSEASLSYSFRL